MDKDSTPLVSIIVPCYNQAVYLPETLDSVLNQTYGAWECIIVNDGSPDDTERVAKEYCGKDSRFKYVYQENQGLASARNTGIHNSEGEYILPLDSDDLIATTYLEKAVNWFLTHPDTKLVNCKGDRFGDKTGLCEMPKFKYDSFIWQNCFFCTAMYRKKDYDKTCGYNSNMKYGYEDWDFWISLLDENSKVHLIDEVLFHYRYRKGSMISNSDKHSDFLCAQIVRNHPEVYSKYMDNIFFYKRGYDKYFSLYEHTVNSYSYKIGRFLLTPFILLKKLIFRLFGS